MLMLKILLIACKLLFRHLKTLPKYLHFPLDGDQAMFDASFISTSIFFLLTTSPNTFAIVAKQPASSCKSSECAAQAVICIEYVWQDGSAHFTVGLKAAEEVSIITEIYFDFLSQFGKELQKAAVRRGA